MMSLQETNNHNNNNPTTKQVKIKLKDANRTKLLLSFSLRNALQVYETVVEESTKFMSYTAQARKEVGRTEAISADTEVYFHNRVEWNYAFEDTQALYIQVWKQGRDSYQDTPRKLWGEVWISVGQLLVRFGSVALLPLVLSEPSSRKQDPMLEITAVEPKYVKTVLSMHLAAAKLKKPSAIFGSIRPILIIQRSYLSQLTTVVHSLEGEDDETLWETVYETEPVKEEENIFHSLTKQKNMFDFGRLELSQEDLDRGNAELPLSLQVVHLKKTGQRSLIGSFLTNEKFLSSQPSNSIFPLKSPAGRDQLSPPGYIVLLSPLHTHTLWTFLDYIIGGCELKLIFAIDFTASNGNPKQPGTLHYCGDASRLNEYERAIREIASVLLEYQIEQQIACYGFGAKLPPYEKTHHCFPLTLIEGSPYFYGLEDVLAGYHSILSNIQFHELVDRDRIDLGPTVLSQVIKTATDMAMEQKAADNASYFILFILTDGAISDVHATTEEIQRASQCAPLSIVIVGIGSDDFKDMDALSSCYSLQRPILQFIPYRSFRSNNSCSIAIRKVLAEIPQQMLCFMKLAQMKPKRPKRRSFKLYPGIVEASAPSEAPSCAHRHE